MEVAKPNDKSPKRLKRALEAVPELADNGNCQFARALGSPDYCTREKGLQALTAWLTRKASIDGHDMARIWKGLFYCFWHSDKTPIQMELADKLASIVSQLSDEVAFLYFSVFIDTMRREWFGIDHLRLNKFLMLIRQFFNQLLRMLQKRKWQTALVSQYTALLQSEVLLPTDNQRATGLAYHVCDVWLPEVIKVVSESNKPPSSATLALLLQPFCEALTHADEVAMVRRVRESVFDLVLEQMHEPSEGQPLRHLDSAQLAQTLFNLGAQADVLARNRGELYGLSEALEAAARKRARREGSPSTSKAAAAAQQLQQQDGQEGLPSSSTEKKKKKKKKDNKAGVEEEALESGAVVEVEVEEAPSTGRKGKKQKQALQAAAADACQPSTSAPPLAVEAPDQLPATANSGPAKKTPKSAKKAARRAEAGLSDVSNLGGAMDLAPGSKSTQQQGGGDEGENKRGEVRSAGPGSGAVAGTSGSPGMKKRLRSQDHITSSAPANNSAKKSVHINLRKNLYHAYGSPAPRNTPTPAHKGGILKHTTSTPNSAPPAVGGASRMCPAGSELGRAPKKAVTPRTVIRAKASSFF